MEDLISIIVPVYNTAEYLSDCVRSVLEQTHPCFELLLIDDGSTDGSIAFCEKICETDERVRLLKQSHRGVSAARNAGLREAKGDYLFFLDSDDMIHPALLETLCGLLKKEQMAIAAVSVDPCEESDTYQELLNRKITLSERGDSVFLENREVLDNLFGSDYSKLFCMLGGKMLRRDMGKSLRFDECLTNSEDAKFVYQLIADGVSAVILNNHWYYYRQRGSGASNDFSYKACQSFYQVERYICDREKASGRAENAAKKESIIVNKLMDWYLQSRKRHDTEMRKFVKKAALYEEKLEIFAELSAYQKRKFHVIFHCYPLFLLINHLKT